MQSSSVLQQVVHIVTTAHLLLRLCLFEYFWHCHRKRDNPGLAAGRHYRSRTMITHKQVCRLPRPSPMPPKKPYLCGHKVWLSGDASVVYMKRRDCGVSVT
jgi:hypothetical protein